MLLTQKPPTPKCGDGKGPVVKPSWGGMSKKIAAAVLQRHQWLSQLLPTVNNSLCFFKLSEGSVKPMHPSNTINLLCYSGKLGIWTIVFLETVLKALILGSSVDPLYSLVTNQEQKLSFLTLQEIYLMWSRESLWAWSNTLNPWQSFHLVIWLER